MRGRGVVPVADKGRSAMIAGPADSAQLVKRQQARARTDANIAAVRGVYQRAITELEAHGGREETERAKALRAFVQRTEERRVGQEGVSTCSSWGWPYN